jgi:hypothetical protein
MLLQRYVQFVVKPAYLTRLLEMCPSSLDIIFLIVEEGLTGWGTVLRGPTGPDGNLVAMAETM